MTDIETDEIIQKAINDNYVVFLGYDLLFGDITMTEYLQKLKEHNATKLQKDDTNSIECNEELK